MTYLHNTGKISARITDQSSSLQREKKTGSKWNNGRGSVAGAVHVNRIIY